MMMSLMTAMMPTWPGLDTTPRLQRRLMESRESNDSMRTKQILREVSKAESLRRKPLVPPAHKKSA